MYKLLCLFVIIWVNCGFSIINALASCRAYFFGETIRCRWALHLEVQQVLLNSIHAVCGTNLHMPSSLCSYLQSPELPSISVDPSICLIFLANHCHLNFARRQKESPCRLDLPIQNTPSPIQVTYQRRVEFLKFARKSLCFEMKECCNLSNLPMHQNLPQ